MAGILTLGELCLHCESLPGATMGFPFDSKTLVFKVNGKIFVLFDVEDFQSINVKCDPERALGYREQFQGVKPGYHMNKRHWNTVSVDADVPAGRILEWVTDSYHLVAKPTRRRKATGEA